MVSAQRIGGLDDIRSAARALAGRIEHEALGVERIRRKRAAFGEIASDRRLATPRSRANVTWGVYLRVSGSTPMRLKRRSCSACRSINAGSGLTLATIARGLSPPNQLRPSKGPAPRARADLAEGLVDVASGARVDDAAQPRERHVGRSICASRARAPMRLKPPLLFSLQIHQRRVRLHLGDDRARLVAAEPAQSLEANERLRPADLAERLLDVSAPCARRCRR